MVSSAARSAALAKLVSPALYKVNAVHAFGWGGAGSAVPQAPTRDGATGS